MAPPQPTRPSPFHFENLNASSSADAWPMGTTQQFLNRVQGVAASRNQQNVPFANENNIQLGLGLHDDYWTYVKKLTRSDVSHHHCRLLLNKSFVENHILPNITDAGQCSSADGIPIAVWDADESCEFHLTLKHWPKSYVLHGNWIPDFVTRKGLQEGDEVGLTYHGSTLYFKHLN